MNEENKTPKTVPPHEVYIDFSGETDKELRKILEDLLKEEAKVSYQRRVLHGKIDLLRAELVQRKKSSFAKGESIISDADISKLSAILAGEAFGPQSSDPTGD